MTFMGRLRILIPGCPLEKALLDRAKMAEQMSSDLADMADTATQFMERRYHDVHDLDHTDRRKRA